MLAPSEKGPQDLEQWRPANRNAALISDLNARRAEWADAGVRSITAIGDALAPATIAHAMYAGRRYAEEFDAAPLGEGELPFRRELTELLSL